jgi:hypothetical protein
MQGSFTEQLDKQTSTVERISRRSARVLLRMRIEVRGKDTTERVFVEDANTLVVNAHGALIELAAPVLLGQRITVSNSATRHSRRCRVAYLGASFEGKVRVGVEFLRPSPSFWQIAFPPDDWATVEN